MGEKLGYITYYNGNIFDSTADIICHQVNTYGVMGAGIAKEVRERFPEVYKEYKEACDRKADELIGDVVVLRAGDRYIANCFGQIGWNTNYIAFRCAMERLVRWAEQSMVKTVAIPYKMGCGLAGGKWEVVEPIIKSAFSDTYLDLEIWKLEEGKKTSAETLKAKHDGGGQNELKPCPFCGGEARIHLPDFQDLWTYAWCSECHASSGKSLAISDSKAAKARAISVWNTRKQIERD